LNCLLRTIILGLIVISLPAVLNAQLIVNEVSQGPSGNKEYVELLVQGTPGCTDYFFNLSLWIVDDNCGFFGQGSGTGIALGHLRFRNIAPWTQIRYGSIILIYNSADPNALIPPHDYFDANGDCVYVLPDTCYLFERGSLPTSTAGISSYSGSNYTALSSWSATMLANSGDAIATIAPGNLSAPYHAVAWGNSSLGQSIYFANSAAGRSYRMINAISNNPFLSANWEPLDVSFPNSETPGLPNNGANAFWIQQLKSGCANYVQVVRNQAVTLCFGDSLLVGGSWRKVSGQYTDTIPAAIGCDTIEQINLSVLPALETSVSVSVCAGQAVVFGGQLLMSTGTYRDTLLSASGCDSVVVLQLTVWPVVRDTVQETICAGESYAWHNQLYSQSGWYTDTLSSPQGCDSLLTLRLVVRPVVRDTIITGICPGGTYLFGGQLLSQSGVYTDTLSGSSGCDSMVTLQLQVAASFISPQVVTVCSGEDYFFNGSFLIQSDLYYDTLTAALGCDSIVQLSFTRIPDLLTNESASLCAGDSLFFGGRYWSSAGTYHDTLSSASGCDSIIVLTLQVLTVYSDTQLVSLCAGESYWFNGMNLTQSGEYTDNFTAQNGCDSVVHLLLFFYPSAFDTTYIQSCTGQTISWGTQSISQSGVYIDTALSVAGCDSFRVAVVTLFPLRADSMQYIICRGDTFGDKIWYTDSIFQATYTSVYGCDSNYKKVFRVVDPEPVNLGEDQLLPEGTLITLQADYSTSVWSTGVNGISITINVQDTSLYWVEQADLNNCFSRDSIIIYMLPEEIVAWTAPTAFTPNDDGHNDVFRLLLQPGVRQVSLSIFNRWGKCVFTADPYAAGWDGRYRGEDQEVGVYVFTGIIRLPNGQEQAIRGQFSLLR
jgi:gliding motility-associated-like protein